MNLTPLGQTRPSGPTVEHMDPSTVITPPTQTGATSTALAITPGSAIAFRPQPVNLLDSLASNNPQYRAILAKLQTDMGIDRVIHEVQELKDGNAGIQQSIQTLESQLSDVATSNTSKWDQLMADKEKQREQDRIDKLEQEKRAQQQGE